MNEIIVKQKDNQVIMSTSDFITLCESLKKGSEYKIRYTEFEKHIGVNTKTNCSMDIYKQIWKLKDDGLKKRQIVGKTLKKDNGKNVVVTIGIYNNAMVKRKGLQI